MGLREIFTSRLRKNCESLLRENAGFIIYQHKISYAALGK